MSILDEQSLLGTLMASPECLNQCTRLKPHHFELSGHTLIFQAMRSLEAKRANIDAVTISSELGDDLEKAGGYVGLSEIQDRALMRPDVSYLVNAIMSSYCRRELAAHCASAAEKLCRSNTKEEDNSIADSIESAVYEYRELIAEQQPSHISDIIWTVLNQLEAQRKQTGIPGFSTGIEWLDSATTGIRKGEYWVVGASPARGKTVLAAQIAAVNVAAGVPTLVFSYEMTKEQFARRFLPFQADISATLVRDFRDASEDDSQRVLQAAETMLPWPLWVHDPDGMEGSELTTMARALIRNHKIQLVIVDYLQVIQGDGNDLRARVSAVSNRLRSLAKTEQVAVLALSQLRRPDSEDTRPTMFHLKESGDIEAHAHTVILLYRPKDEDGQWTGEDEIIIGKQREGLVGRTGVVLDQRRLIFRPRT